MQILSHSIIYAIIRKWKVYCFEVMFQGYKAHIIDHTVVEQERRWQLEMKIDEGQEFLDKWLLNM